MEVPVSEQETIGVLPEGYADWLNQLKVDINQARQQAALAVNAELVPHLIFFPAKGRLFLAGFAPYFLSDFALSCYRKISGTLSCSVLTRFFESYEFMPRGYSS
jgi:hypothetical protein